MDENNSKLNEDMEDFDMEDIKKKATEIIDEDTKPDEDTKEPDGEKNNEDNESDVYEMESWDELLKFTRRNYLKTVEELTKVQEQTEKSLKQLIETRTSYSKESSNVIKEWADMLNGSFQKFQSSTGHLIKKARDRASKQLNINFPFQKEFDDFVESVQENIKSIFDKFQK